MAQVRLQNKFQLPIFHVIKVTQLSIFIIKTEVIFFFDNIYRKPESNFSTGNRKTFSGFQSHRKVLWHFWVGWGTSVRIDFDWLEVDWSERKFEAEQSCDFVASFEKISVSCRRKRWLSSDRKKPKVCRTFFLIDDVIRRKTIGQKISWYNPNFYQKEIWVESTMLVKLSLRFAPFVSDREVF